MPRSLQVVNEVHPCHPQATYTKLKGIVSGFEQTARKMGATLSLRLWFKVLNPWGGGRTLISLFFIDSPGTKIISEETAKRDNGSRRARRFTRQIIATRKRSLPK